MDLQIANSWWMYLLGIIVVVFVLVGSLFFIYRAYKEGFSKAQSGRHHIGISQSFPRIRTQQRRPLHF